MSFSTDMATLIANQLSRFVALNRHQLAGQAANLDFWLAQVRHGLEAIDGYGKRYEKLRAAQASHVAEHHTTEFLFYDPCCTQGAPAPPRRVPHAALREARRSLCEAAYRFLVRCCNEELLDEAALRETLNNLGIGLEVADLKRRSL